MRVATFNLQNLRLRTLNGRPALNAAADQDKPDLQRSDALAHADRDETARVIATAEADVIALQEVFDLAALDYFHDEFLRQEGAPAYPFRFCFRGNDGRGLNVAALSRRRPVNARSHAGLTGAKLGLSDLPPDLRDRPLFRRDCLELQFDTVTLFVCHFKAPYPDADKAHEVREAEARAVRRIIEARFLDPECERWIILGDFNEPLRGQESSKSSLEPLKREFSVDLLDRLAPGTDWTYELPGSHAHSCPDRIFISPRLAREYPTVIPQIIRWGMDAGRARSEARPIVEQTDRPHASDHALVYADFPGL